MILTFAWDYRDSIECGANYMSGRSNHNEQCTIFTCQGV